MDSRVLISPTTPLPWQWADPHSVNTRGCLFKGSNDGPVGISTCMYEMEPDLIYMLHAANTLPALEAEVRRLRAGYESIREIAGSNHHAINARIDAILKGGQA